ncbi:MAG: lantibiotic dehydratase [Actinomycetota bacterium]|nr:lantibiotic dehydratase [Actinomycetota bacterium]
MGRLEDLGIEPSGFFVLRTPALPYDDFVALRGASGDRETGSQRERLRASVARPEVRDAVFVASPRIAELLDRWLRGPAESADRKVEHALVRYFSRMTARATPFGLFAGCSSGRVGAATLLQLGDRGDYRRHTRLDMEYLSALVDELERDAEVRALLEYRPNSSLYSRGGKLTYAEARTDEGGRSHYLVAVEDSDYLRRTVERASSGALPHELSEALVDGDVSLDEARSFVEELIDGQVLVSELTPPVTGDEPIDALIPTLERYPVTAKAGATLHEARAALGEIDSCGIGVEPAAYLEVAAALKNLPAKVEPSRLFQVDMIKPAPALSLGPRVVEEIARAVQILHRISGRTNRDDALARFRNAFRDRYGEREVPLLEALDEELGIGFEASATPSAEASPLLAGLPFPTTARDDLAPWRRREQFLLGKVVEATRAARDEIALTAQDLEELAVDSPPLPKAFSVGVTIAAASETDVDRGDFELLFRGLYGPSGGRLIGRFCHADPEQHALLREHLEQEEALHPGVAYAEIVHLPEGRLGNILLRPVLRSYEIPYLGRSGAAQDRQIPVQDLWVSVNAERIVLRSERLDREVRPRLTSAHNYSWRSLGVYRFLCALQEQGSCGGLQWDWGVLEGAPFLPRVRVGRIVLVRASWLLTQRDIGALDEAERERWDDWRRERSMPRVVALADADNELIVDWDNALSVHSFLALVRKRPLVRLVEAWPDEDELIVTGPEGRFRHEILIPFVSSRATASTAAVAPRGSRIKRSFPPGSEWLYAKLYTGTATADAVLREEIRRLTRSWVDARAVESWFFIRYGDPQWHLRLRLHGEPERLTHEVLPQLQAVAGDLLEAGTIWSFQLDTYEREVERYGGPEGVELVEQIFHADSEACVGILTMISGDAGMDARWRLTLRGCDLLLDDFGFSLQEKSAVMRSLRDAFAAEFGASGDLKRHVGARYRREKLALDALLEGHAAPGIEAALRLLHERSSSVRRQAQGLREAGERGLLSRPLGDIASSVVHMHANRLLRSAARAQEMVIYDLLDRLYMARAKRVASER